MESLAVSKVKEVGLSSRFYRRANVLKFKSVSVATVSTVRTFASWDIYGSEELANSLLFLDSRFSSKTRKTTLSR